MDFKWLLMGAAVGAVLAFFRRGGSVTRGG
jgi:hypothetical protein